MKQPSYKGYGPLPDAIIDAACAGDAEAIDRELRHYDGYINKLCIRKVIGSDSRTHYVVSLLALYHSPPGLASAFVIIFPDYGQFFGEINTRAKF